MIAHFGKTKKTGKIFSFIILTLICTQKINAMEYEQDINREALNYSNSEQYAGPVYPSISGNISNSRYVPLEEHIYEDQKAVEFNWKNIDVLSKDLSVIFPGNKNFREYLSLVCEYSPNNINNINNINNNKHLVIFVSEKEDNKQDRKNSLEALKLYVEELVKQDNLPALLVKFNYSGAVETEVLIKESTCLFTLLNEARHYKITLIGYGMAGIIAKGATHYLNDRDNDPQGMVKIDLFVLLGTPILEKDDTNFTANNFVKLLNFYSTGDVKQIFANLSASTIFNGTAGLRKIENKNSEINIADNNDNSVNSSGIIYNIRTQVDGKECKYDQLKSVLRNLTPILSKLKNYKKHTDLDLNIESFEQREDYRLQLVIRTEKGYQYLDNQESKSEVDYSNTDRRLYFTLYDKEISDKDSKIGQIFSVDYLKAVGNYLSSGFPKFK